MDQEAKDEVLAMEAIYGDAFTSTERQEDGEVSGSLSLSSDLLHSENSQINLILLNQGDDNADDSSSHASFITVSHLPPITLRFHLPRGYPLEKPPKFAIDCCWLSSTSRSRLHRTLLSMWHRDKSVMLFTWADFLANRLNDLTPILGSHPSSPHPVLQFYKSYSKKTTSSSSYTANSVRDYARLVEIIQRFDLIASQKSFEKATFSCGICLEEKRGALCTKLRFCHHVYCKDCLSNFFSLMISDGTIDFVGCPHADCARKTTTTTTNEPSTHRLSDQDLAALVGPGLFKRFEELRLKRSLEGRHDVTYCPRPDCQQPCFREEGEEKFVQCSKCKYPFCYYCSQLWHGYASYCQVRNIVKVVDAYNEGSEFEKARLLKQYGEKAITRMIVEVTNERENLKWVSNNTQVCPTCSTAIEKSEGCNHMHCFTCQTHFCYRCGSYLDAKAPYMHYNDPSSPCFNLLFNQEDLNRDFDVFPEDEEEIDLNLFA